MSLEDVRFSKLKDRPSKRHCITRISIVKDLHCDLLQYRCVSFSALVLSIISFCYVAEYHGPGMDAGGNNFDSGKLVDN